MASYALSLLKKFSERDTQRKIGPSDIADPCEYCLAEKLLAFLEKDNTPREWGRWWLAARIGTAVHGELEVAAQEVEFFQPESKVEVHCMDNYGMIKGTCDLYDESTHSVVDFKTTERLKLAKIKQAQHFLEAKKVPTTLEETIYTLTKYKGQTHLYAYGKEKQGFKVTQIVISFICRDGKTDADIWDTDPVTYERDYAEALLARLEAIWEAVQEDRHLEQFAQHRLCFTCSRER